MKSTSTNVHRNRATTAAAVPIYRKAIVANVQPVTRARIAKRSKAIASRTRVQRALCAKTNRAMEITRVCVAAATLATIATLQLIRARQTATPVRTEHHAWLCNRVVSNAIAYLAGPVNCAMSISTIVQRTHVCWALIVPI